MDIEFLNNFNWLPLMLTFKLALITTVILILVGVPIAYFLAFSKNKFKVIPEVFIAMPLVLPPTVLGFYLLIAFSPNSIIGSWFNQYLGIQLAFTFTGIVIGSVIYSLPFMVQPIQNAFQSLPIGEFGVVLMIGGSIPNKTKVASIAIYEKVESLKFLEAHQYALLLFVISFVILLGVNTYNRTKNNLLLSFYKK